MKYASRGPVAAAVAKKATGVRHEFHTGRAGTRYRRPLAYTPATPATTASTPTSGLRKAA